MKKPKILALIPTRLNSRRLPAKSLLPINNLPLIIHVYRRALISKKISEAIICCDDKKILKVAEKFGARAMLTSKKHPNGTDRICEAFKKLKKNFDLVVDIQGDEPLISPLYISRANIPYEFLNKIKKIKKHLSVVSFKPKALLKFGKSARSEMEMTEDIELLRALDIGLKIKTIDLKGDSFSVDVFEDYTKAKAQIIRDRYFKFYRS